MVDVSQTTVEMEGVSVRFRKRAALNDVDLTFGHGLHGLLGPNGAGKTTLIRVLATLVEPDSGRVELLGLSGRRARERTQIRRRLGYLPQTFGYFARFTVREFVEYFAWLKQMPSKDIPAAATRVIAQVGLADRAEDRLRTLSGGMLRRAGIAQAIVNSPALLLLDEPTAGLDPEQRVEFRSLVAGLAEQATILISTHLVEDVASVCEGVTILHDGRVAYRGTAQDLTALGMGEQPPGSGDSPIERGYARVLTRFRARAPQ